MGPDGVGWTAVADLPEVESTVLIVEDNPFLVRSWTRMLQISGYGVLCAGSLQAAQLVIDRWRELPCDYVLLDLKLPDGDGARLLAQFSQLDPPPLVAVVTAHLDFERALDLYGRCALSAPKPETQQAILKVLETLSRLRVAGSKHEAAVKQFATKYQLSDREAALLLHAVAGEAPETSELVGCNPNTLNTYWKRIFKKTGLKSQRDVVNALWRMYTG